MKDFVLEGYRRTRPSGSRSPSETKGSRSANAGMISAVSPERAIGLQGRSRGIPGDMRRFVRVTRGSVVVMGRLTWESIDRKPLPNRRNVVISRSDVADVEHYGAIDAALKAFAASGETRDVWFIGGARIYTEAMPYCDVMDLTYVPDSVTSPDACNPPPSTRRCGEPVRSFRTRTSRGSRGACSRNAGSDATPDFALPVEEPALCAPPPA